MELKYKGQFYRDIDIHNRQVLDAVRDAILNVKSASGILQIHNLKKLRKYSVHYRIKIANDFRIGVVIRKNTIWFTCFGHRNIFYKKLFP